MPTLPAAPEAGLARLLLLLTLWLAAPAAAEPAASDAAAAAEGSAIFVDRAEAAGLDFVHFNGMSGEKYFCEIVGSGAALFDYDNDGDLDVYLVQGKMLGPGKTVDQALRPLVGEARDRLFRNDLETGPDGRGRLRFTEVTEASGIRSAGYGMGVATGDLDNDGWVDLYITNFGPNELWRNRGDGTFEKITEKAGAQDVRWSIPAAFFDFDRDGWLDLYVGNYVDFTVESHKLCRTIAGVPDYCGPLAFAPLPDRLLRNRGDGTFEDHTVRGNIASAFGGALGVATADFDGNGWLDVYVGNDGTPNQMWINSGDGRFENEALFAGTAVNAMGRPEASMGATVADFDADGDEDIFLTHLVRETNTIYVNDGTGIFDDGTVEAGLGSASFSFTGFGTTFFDYDNDGWLDLLAANGAVRLIAELEAAGDPFPLHQINQLFHNLGGGRYEEVTARAGAVFELSEVSRGVAAGDIDNDGDTDIVLTNNAGPVRLLINQVGQERPWVGFRVMDGKRDAIGARVGVFRRGAPALWRRVATSGSYESASDPRVLIGLGESPEIEKVVVEWLGGGREEFSAEPGRYTTLERGRGRKGPAGTEG